MDTEVSLVEAIVRLSAAAVFGAALGFEREWKQKSAGLRTHMMVSLGAATFTLTGFELLAGLPVDDPRLRTDPLRILEGVVGGLGFLGAGAILRHGASVKGLTTAGSLWLAGAIGMAVGGGLYALSATAAALGLLVLIVVKRVEDHLPPKAE